MKRILTIGLIAFLLSCGGDNKNELMTNLINEKKIVEDSISMASSREKRFMDQAYEAKKDTTISHPLVDSSTKYYMVGHRLKGKLKTIDFSIDSLSKMK